MRPILITAGATRNPLDAIRYLSAFSSGTTGVGLARALSDAGAVTLLGSAEACLRAGSGLETEEFISTRDLMARMERWVTAHPTGIVIHAAAVGDYEAAEGDGEKIPSGQSELIIRLRPTPKILDRISDWSADAKIISFKAASPETTDARLVE
ncbi:MAG: phosphopantothenoylcysteine synthetase/decarboxylase, partial [Myxococcota bacterium]